MDPTRFAYSAALLLIVAAISVSISKKIGLGGILGLLGAGLVLGPFTPGPALTGNVEGVRHFSELGVVFLMFLIGLEIHPSHLWDMRKSLFGMGGAQIVATTALLCGFMMFMGHGAPAALVLGAGLALSSTAFVVQMLRERKELGSDHGKAAFAVLLMQDIAVVPLLSLLPLLASGHPAAGAGHGAAAALNHPAWLKIALAAAMVSLVVAAGKFAVPRALGYLAKQGNRESFFLVSLAAMFLAAIAMDYVGMSMALGAFLMGMMLSDSKFCYQIEASIEPFKGLLMSVFFVSVGMSIDPAVIASAPVKFGSVVLGTVLVNVVAMFAVASLFGERRSVAVKTAFLLAQGGEFGFVVFGAAKAYGVLDSSAFAVAVAVISVTMALTPVLVKIGDALASRLDPAPSALPVDPGHAPSGARAVICGYGRVGHSVGTILQAQGVEFVAFDANPVAVAKWRAEGHPVFYGDLSNPDILAGAALASAEILVMTIDDPETALKACSAVRSAHPDIQIVARARDLSSSCDAFARIGVSVSVPETLEASLRLAAESLGALGVSDDSAEALLRGVRDKERLPDRRETE